MKLNINLSLFKKNKNVLQTETEQPLAAPVDPVEQAILETIEKAFKGDLEACKDVFEGETDPSYKSVLNKYYPDPGKQNNLKVIALKTLADQEQPDFDAVNQLVTILEDKTNILHTPVKVFLKAAHKGGTTAEFTKIYRGKLHEKINSHNASVIVPTAANNNTEEVNPAELHTKVIPHGAAEEPESKEVASDVVVDALKDTTAVTEPEQVISKKIEETTLLNIDKDAIPHDPAEEVAPAIVNNEEETIQNTPVTTVIGVSGSPQEQSEPVVAPENTEEKTEIVPPVDNQEEDEQTIPSEEENVKQTITSQGSVWGKNAVPAFNASASFKKMEDVENKDRLFYQAAKSMNLEATQTVYQIFYAKNEDGTPKSLSDLPDLEMWKEAMIGHGKFKNKNDFEQNITWMRGIVVLDLAEAPDLNHANAKAELMNAFEQLQQSKFYILDPETQSVLNAYTERYREPTNSKKARGLLTLASHGHPQASFAMFKNIRDKNPEILSILQKAGFESKDGYKDLAHRFLYSAALEKDIDAMKMVNASIVRPTTSGQAKMLEMLHSLGLYDQKHVTRYFQKYIAEYNGEVKTIPGTLINFPLINKARNILAERLKILYPNLDAPSPAQRMLLKKQEEERQLRAKKIENRMSAIDNLDNLDEKQQNSLLQFSMTEAGSPDTENDPWTEAFINKGWTAEDINTLKAKTLIQTAANSDSEENAKKANEYCLEAWFNQSHPRYKRLVEILHVQPGNLTDDMNFTWGDFLLVKNAEQDPRAYDKIAHDLEHEKKNGQTGVLQVLRFRDINLEEDALEIKITFDQMLQKKDWAARRVFDAMAEPAMEGEETATKGDHYFHLLSEKGAVAFEALVNDDYVGRQIVRAVDHMREEKRYPEDTAILELFSENHQSMIGTAVANQAIFKMNATALMLIADAIDYPEKTPYAQEIDEALDNLGVHDKEEMANMGIYSASLFGEPNSSIIMLKSISGFSKNEHHRDRVEYMKETGFLPKNLTLNGNVQSVKEMAMGTFIIKYWHDNTQCSDSNFVSKPYPPMMERNLEERREHAIKLMGRKMQSACTKLQLISG